MEILTIRIMRETNHEYYIECKKYGERFAHGKITYQIFTVLDNNNDSTTVTSLFFT